MGRKTFLWAVVLGGLFSVTTSAFAYMPQAYTSIDETITNSSGSVIFSDPYSNTGEYSSSTGSAPGINGLRSDVQSFSNPGDLSISNDQYYLYNDGTSSQLNVSAAYQDYFSISGSSSATITVELYIDQASALGLGGNAKQNIKLVSSISDAVTNASVATDQIVSPPGNFSDESFDAQVSFTANAGTEYSFDSVLEGSSVFSSSPLWVNITHSEFDFDEVDVYLTADTPGVTITALSGHDYTKPYVMPEPASFAPLALGLLFLRRKRTKRPAAKQ